MSIFTYLIAIVYAFANKVINCFANQEQEVGNKLQMRQDAYPQQNESHN